MSGHPGPVPGGKDLLEFVNSVAAELHELHVLRGFELATMSILLHLDRSPAGQLICSRADLSRYSGLLESTAWRLTKLLASRKLIAIQKRDEMRLVLSLTLHGRRTLIDITSALKHRPQNE